MNYTEKDFENNFNNPIYFIELLLVIQQLPTIEEQITEIRKIIILLAIIDFRHGDTKFKNVREFFEIVKKAY